LVHVRPPSAVLQDLAAAAAREAACVIEELDVEEGVRKVERCLGVGPGDTVVRGAGDAAAIRTRDDAAVAVHQSSVDGANVASPSVSELVVWLRRKRTGLGAQGSGRE
jgi:hypothetical protein